jgi:hypothetical protein
MSNVLPSAELRLQQFGTRVSLVPGDFFQAVPEGGDVYILSRILHDWPDHEVHCILCNIRKAMSPRATLVVLELALVGPTGLPNKAAHLSDIEMLLFSSGLERTSGEYRDLLRAAGFAISEVTSVAEGYHAFKCEPVP